MFQETDVGQIMYLSLFFMEYDPVFFFLQQIAGIIYLSLI